MSLPKRRIGVATVQLAQQRGGDGCVGLATVELVLASVGQVVNLAA